MTEVLLRVLVVAFMAAALVAVAVILRKLAGGPALTTLFTPKSQKRIDVIEQTPIDAKRRLVLVRRDDVEHLLLTGGPVDIVVEAGIGANAALSDTRTRPPAAQATLPRLGQAAE